MPAAESRVKRTIPLGRARLNLSDCARHAPKHGRRFPNRSRICSHCRTRSAIRRGGGLDDQLATRQCVEERGLDRGTWLDLEEVGDLGDDRGRDDDRALEPPKQRGAGLVVQVLGVASPPAGRSQR
jgi:hypothetical protein